MTLIHKDYLFTHPRAGRATLQIPDTIIGDATSLFERVQGKTPWISPWISPIKTPDKFLEVEVEDLEQLSGNYLPSASGFLYWSRTGYEKFKPLILAEFSPMRGVTIKSSRSQRRSTSRSARPKSRQRLNRLARS